MSLINSAVTAINVLIQGVNIAQTHGVYDLQEARILAEAIEFLTISDDENEPATQDETTVYKEELNTQEISLNNENLPDKKYIDNTIPIQRSLADKIVMEEKLKNKT